MLMAVQYNVTNKPEHMNMISEQTIERLVTAMNLFQNKHTKELGDITFFMCTSFLNICFDNFV